MTSNFRPDIQGLRGLAVLSVVIYHIWPEWLSGGYIGVDIFFVISGYLITALLIRETEKTGSISLRAFYTRRVRRLIPAATVVLLFTGAATLLLAPRFMWLDIAYDIGASTLYIQNWHLAAKTIDYLAAEETAGPLMHFWSLAIEEQYYIVWPLLILASTTLLARQVHHITLLTVVSLVVLGSLWLSVKITYKDPSLAYFVSHTRFWELGIGSLLALMKTRHDVIPKFLGWLGLGMIAASLLTFTNSTPFPGYAAILPTLGAALVIWAGGNGNAHERLLLLPPLKFFGDISYSLYLWHWPLIIFSGYAFSEEHGLLGGASIMIASIIAAWLSKIHIEDRYRYGKTTRYTGTHLTKKYRSNISPLTIFIGSMTISAVMVIGIYSWVNSTTVTVTADSARDYPGAAALVGGIPTSDGIPFIPALESARSDLSRVYNNNDLYHIRIQDTVPRGYDVGPKSDSPVVVLVGDSHAAHWIPAFEGMADTAALRFISHTKSACGLTLSDQIYNKKPYTECTEWSHAVLDELEGIQPDVLILARSHRNQLYGYQDNPDQASVEMLTELFDRLIKITPNVLVIRDTPRMPFDPLKCLGRNETCQVSRKDAMQFFDPLLNAAEKHNRVQVIDMTDGICDDKFCKAVVGNILVWRDTHHITATYARTMAPLLKERLSAYRPN